LTYQELIYLTYQEPDLGGSPFDPFGTKV